MQINALKDSEFSAHILKILNDKKDITLHTPLRYDRAATVDELSDSASVKQLSDLGTEISTTIIRDDLVDKTYSIEIDSQKYLYTIQFKYYLFDFGTVTVEKHPIAIKNISQGTLAW